MSETFISGPGAVERMRLAVRNRYAGYFLEAAAAAGALKRGGDRAEKPFVIFGRGRSGSTLLVKLLDSHPEIECEGEVLRYPVMFPDAYLRNCLAGRGGRAVGFKLLSYQLRDMLRLPPETSYLRDLQAAGFSVIYLHRRNLFRHALSNLYASKRGVYHQAAGTGDASARIRIAPAELFSWMEGSEALGRYERAVLAGVDALDIVYEVDLATPEAQGRTLSTIVSRLGLEPRAAQAELRRTTPDSVESFVANFDEVLAAVRGSRFAPFLTSDG